MSCVLTASALALPVAMLTPAAQAQKADKETRVAECVSYDQKQRDDSIDVSLQSSCSMDLECSVRWQLTCEGSKDVHHEAKVFPLLAGTTSGVSASADRCGDAGWAINKIRWSCKTSH